MPERVAVYPAAGSGIGWASWLREIAAGMAVTLWPAPPPSSVVARGDGHRVLLIPGFSSGDWSLVRLKAFLQRSGYRPATAGIWFNPGPTRRLMHRLENRLAALSGEGKVTLIGVSLGGTLARDLARRHPDQVRAVITLCSPVRFPVTTPLAPFASILSPFHVAEWVARRHDIEKPLPVPVTALHAMKDGVVLREQCWLAELSGGRNVVVGARHMTAASHPQALEAIAEALATC
jgi:pimeloyl-ACP methyl ester carboxylesterase